MQMEKWGEIGHLFVKLDIIGENWTFNIMSVWLSRLILLSLPERICAGANPACGIVAEEEKHRGKGCNYHSDIN